MCAESQIRYSSGTLHTLAAKLAQSTDPADLRAAQELRKTADTLWAMDKARVDAQRAAAGPQEYVQGILASVESEAHIGGIEALRGTIALWHYGLGGRRVLTVQLDDSDLGDIGKRVLVVGDLKR